MLFQPYYLFLLHIENFFRFLSVKLVLLKEILLFSMSACIIISRPLVRKLVERSQFAHLIILLHQSVKLANYTTLRPVTALNILKHIADWLSTFFLRKLVVGVL